MTLVNLLNIENYLEIKGTKLIIKDRTPQENAKIFKKIRA